MALKAVTSIQHWQEAEQPPQADRVLIPAGETVDESLFSNDELQELKDLGAVVEEGDLQKEEDLREQVRKLQEELANKDQELQAAKSQQQSPGTLFQTQAVTEDNVEDLGEDNDPPPGGARPAVVSNEGLAAAGGSKVVKDGKVQDTNKSGK